MTDPQPAEATVTIASHTIELALTGKPDTPYKWGPGSIRPAFITFTYRPNGIHAHLYGVWVRRTGEVSDDPCDQDYRIGDPDEWPGWMTELARKHKPAGPASATDRVALREIAAQAIRDAACSGDCGDTEEACVDKRVQAAAWHRGVLTEVLGTPEAFADAVLPVLPAPADRAAEWRAAADALNADTDRFFADWPDEPRNSPYALGRKDAAIELRRRADEAQQGTEQGEPDARPGTTDYTLVQRHQAHADQAPQLEAGPDFVTRVLELFSLSHADAYGDLFWRVDDGEVRLFANVSDVFAWAGSDCEPIPPDTLPALEQAYTDLKAIEAEEFTAELYTARQRGQRPQGAAYPSGTHEAWRKVSALYDACGPERELGLGNPKAAPAHEQPAAVQQPKED